MEITLMSINLDSSDSIDDRTLEIELNCVKKYLREFQNEFYKRILTVPGISPSELPLVMWDKDGLADQFSSEIDYYFYPLLFSDVFPSVDKKQLQTLCIIAQLYAESQVQLDNFIDNQLPTLPEVMKMVVLIGSQYKLTAAIRKLSQLFDSESPFWDRFDQLFEDYICQIIEEKVSHQSLEVPSLQEMERSASGKVALVKILTAAMAELSGNREPLPMIEESQDLFSVGYQLYDDVKDWQKDYQKGRYSYLLKKAFKEFGIDKKIIEGRAPDPKDLGFRLYLLLFPDILEIAAGYVKRSIEAVAGINCPKWISWLEMQQNSMLILRSDFIKIRDRAIERAKLKATPKCKSVADSFDLKSCDEALTKGIAFLQDQERKNYIEAAHLEMIGRRNSHTNGSVCCWGTVFQRAVTLHSLAQARQAGFSLDEEAFVADLQILIESKLKDRRGGWSYFPDVPHMPPDCDDLAEVLHVLIASSHPNIAKLCDDPITLALQGQKSDGSISTWIADPSNPSTVKTRDYMHDIWGAEPDIDVMANFIYALWKYDRNRFADNILKGTSYIVSKQGQEGSWASSWYNGPYYGTWVCCRHLAAVGGYAENSNRARDFLLKTQRIDGGWDIDEGGILNTSYALLTLINHMGEKDQGVIRPSAQRILNLQRDNGSWSGSPFIKMTLWKKDSPSATGSKHLFYESATMSTAFAVRSLLALRNVLYEEMY